MRLGGNVFVVTGGGDGIGRAVVLELLRRGARVAALDLREEGLAGTVRLADVPADRLTSHVVDVSDVARVDTVSDEVLTAHGSVDGLLNVAGVIQRFVPFTDLAATDIEKVMAVNFWGVVHTTRAFLPHLLTRPEAALVNVSSMGAFVPVPGQTVYGASKAAVMLLTEGLYAELRGTPVSVTVVHPGGVATHITENSGVEVPGGDRAAAQKGAPSVTSAEDAARQVVDGMASGAFRVVIGKDARMLDRLARLSPRRATDLVARRMAALLG
ncbi:SDR family NAD(P)-dependent oxidoreductase [Phycicoccus sonneratiae]|uniref:SDR family oxidoreductase n=1 Tax=Phycicoccus sonneratiae TaxID=2807628 RepID=A0ABS2CSU9_9MICO|nr:SDR family oxidoreductase [Phycicoccus sonneraticus]MBM6402189.1 SDR family oxidoreductase [Phycicoccus sonneraticus]